MKTSRMERDGISLRAVHIALVIGAVAISCLMIFSTYHLSTNFQDLTKVSEQQIELSRAARDLTDASDYLTERVQRFSVQGDLRFAEEYFAEAFDANHREQALEKMSEIGGNSAAYRDLQSAMDASVDLMNTEYYSMKLVVEAKGYTDYPELLRTIELTEEDKALSPDEKMSLAAKMVHDDKYYEQKDQIRERTKASLSDLEQMAYDADASALKALSDELSFVRLIIILQVIGIVIMVWLTSRLGIHPVLSAVERIKADRPIPEVGANEFRYLARTYNKMYEVYKSSLEHLNFKASHDGLTGAYNRSGYELLLSSIDLNSTYMLLFDVDDFKNINDEYGHEAGDKALIKLVRVLKSNFRSDDYVCRIGGDEFVVFMVHAKENQDDLITQKISEINEQLSEAAEGLPPISVSVGIACGADASNIEGLFENTDEAMYQSKRRGKNTFTFYSKGVPSAV